ncbi:lichenan permease IIC component [Oxobacter pfennigii]|uniref:Lichenan permease IIC component n=1 Tax=Oxobacter pfennigii TaxID=36849 RepID=A0A0P8W5W7_9CLOT|nr:PTS transporter subunit EIIC [Oxobacter pfennigii]KPU43090.1 lichenan permease IIC component [Oxobacter pfennigii]
MKEKLTLLKTKLIEILDKHEKNLYVSNVKDILVSLCFPMTLIGSIFYIAANPPEWTNTGLLKLWTSAAYGIREQLMIPYYLTYGMAGITASFMLSYCLAKNKNLDPLLSALITAISYLAILIPGYNDTALTLLELSKITGPSSLLSGFIISAACINLLALIKSKNMGFTIKKGVSPALSYGFKNIFPIMIVVPFMWLIGWGYNILLNYLTAFLSPAFINYKGLLGSSFAKAILGSLQTSLMYIIGMNGEVLGTPSYSIFSNLGGASTLLPLIILFLLSPSKHLKQLGTLCIIPGIFNIPYPVLLAVPIILNPVYALPFIAHSILSTFMNEASVSSGLISIEVHAISGTAILSGNLTIVNVIFIILLQLLNIALGLCLYYPFYKLHEEWLIISCGTKSEKTSLSIPLISRVKIIIDKLHSLTLINNNKGRPL